VNLTGAPQGDDGENLTTETGFIRTSFSLSKS